MAIFSPVNPVSKVAWKGFMAMIAPIREPSYPLAQAQQKAMKTAKYSLMEFLLHLSILDSCTAAKNSAYCFKAD